MSVIRIIPFALLLACFISFASCAEAEDTEDQPSEDAQSDSDAAIDVEIEPDVSDVGEEEPIASDPDLEPEDVRDVELVGECEPFTVECTEDHWGIRRCSYDGAWLEPSMCAVDEVCQELETGAECVECTPGENCRDDEPICEPNEPFCYDFETAAQCTADGYLGATVQCSGRCFGGGCHNAGEATGELCTENEGCQGRACLCGSEDAANSSTALCDGNLASGYCTTSSCDANGCDPDTEVCADFTMSGAFGNDNYCLLKANCAYRLYDCADAHRGTGHVCRELPSTNWNATRRTWELACWVPPPAEAEATCTDANCMSPLGGACLANNDCVGGMCLRNGDGLSYCAASCDETHECPSYTSCVRVTDLGDAFYCLANANPTDCPRLANFDIISRTFSTIGGITTAQVCFFRE